MKIDGTGVRPGTSPEQVAKPSSPTQGSEPVPHGTPPAQGEAATLVRGKNTASLELPAPNNVRGALKPESSAATEAKRLLAETRIGTDYSVWDRVLDLLKEVFTLGVADTRLCNDRVLLGMLTERLSELPPDSPIISKVFELMPWSWSDDAARYLFDKKGQAWIDGLSISARKRILQSVREGWISPADRKLFNSTVGKLRSDELRSQLDALEDPAQRDALRERFKKLLADDSGYKVRFGDAEIPVGYPATRKSWVVDAAYWNVDRILEKASSPERVAEAMAAPLVRDSTGLPVHFETLLFRPGLANKAPSASHLFRLAQHSERTVLMYAQQDAGAGSALRELSEYQGAPVPEALRGKLFAIGRPEHVLQTYRAGAGTMIEQLDQIQRRGPELGINTEEMTVFAYSQGNVETTLARLVLAANGHPRVIKQHIAMAPALRGSLVVDNTGVQLFGKLASGEEGRKALADLDPDVVGSFVPEFMRTTIDLSYVGDLETEKKPEIRDITLGMLNPIANDGLGRGGGDGLVDYRSADFAREVRVASTALDHVAMVANVPDELLALVGPPEESSLRVLEQLAGRHTSNAD